MCAVIVGPRLVLTSSTSYIWYVTMQGSLFPSILESKCMTKPRESSFPYYVWNQKWSYHFTEFLPFPISAVSYLMTFRPPYKIYLCGPSTRPLKCFGFELLAWQIFDSGFTDSNNHCARLWNGMTIFENIFQKNVHPLAVLCKVDLRPRQLRCGAGNWISENESKFCRRSHTHKRELCHYDSV